MAGMYYTFQKRNFTLDILLIHYPVIIAVQMERHARLTRSIKVQIRDVDWTLDVITTYIRNSWLLTPQSWTA